MRSRRPFFTAVTLGILLATGTGDSAVACSMHDGMHDGMQGGMHQEGRMGAGFLERVYELKDLTQEQRKKVDALRDKIRAQMDEGRLNRRALQDALRDKVPLEQLKPLAEKQGQNLAAMIVLHAETRAALEQILTKAQQEEIAEGGHEGHRHGHHTHGENASSE